MKHNDTHTHTHTHRVRFLEVMRLNLVLLLALSLFACKQHGEAAPAQPQGAQDAHFVDKDAVKGLLSSIAGSVTTKSGSSCFANVSSVETVMDSVGNPVFYVINYDPSGFVIMAADNRVSPILAYSAVNSFDLVQARSLGGVGDWLSGTEAYVNDVRRIDTASYDSLAWSSARIAHIITRGAAAEVGNSAPNVPGDKEDPNTSFIDCSVCQSQSILLPLNTKWHQLSPYNNAMPEKICDGALKRVYVGCGAIAVGQLMRYYRYPASYNWDLMPNFSDDNNPSATTAQFLYDIATIMNTQYSCFASSTGVDAAVPALKSFGYSASSINFSHLSETSLNIIKNNIVAGRPVLIRGAKPAGGHIWVIHGCHYITFCQNHANTNTNVFTFYHNWGWESGSGWYTRTQWKNLTDGMKLFQIIKP